MSQWHKYMFFSSIFLFVCVWFFCLFSHFSIIYMYFIRKKNYWSTDVYDRKLCPLFYFIFVLLKLCIYIDIKILMLGCPWRNCFGRKFTNKRDDLKVVRSKPGLGAKIFGRISCFRTNFALEWAQMFPYHRHLQRNPVKYSDWIWHSCKKDNAKNPQLYLPNISTPTWMINCACTISLLLFLINNSFQIVVSEKD